MTHFFHKIQIIVHKLSANIDIYIVKYLYAFMKASLKEEKCSYI